MSSSNSMTPDKEDEIQGVKDSRPHLVILGAGASVAALPDGDNNGKFLPTMDNFVSILGLGSALSKAGIEYQGRNFEDIFSEIDANPELEDFRQFIEQKVRDYFIDLELPEHPTLYDHLLLSLRKKDIIATFNWDPFLVQAYRRNSKYTKRLPKFLFLHGNVMTGFCPEHNLRGAIDARCSKCMNLFTPSKLLFPVMQKNYNQDQYIRNEWDTVEWALKHSFMLTIFGYGAPSTDVEAVELLKKAWNGTKERYMEQVEVIDVKSEDEILNTWEDFIFSHHYDHHTSFYDSWISNHPRRTYEAYYSQYWEAKWIENNPIPQDASFCNLWEWYDELVRVEEAEGVDNHI